MNANYGLYVTATDFYNILSTDDDSEWNLFQWFGADSIAGERLKQSTAEWYASGFSGTGGFTVYSDGNFYFYRTQSMGIT